VAAQQLVEHAERQGLLDAARQLLLLLPDPAMGGILALVSKQRELQDRLVEIEQRVKEHERAFDCIKHIKAVAGHEGTNVLLTNRQELAAVNSARGKRRKVRRNAEALEALDADPNADPETFYSNQAEALNVVVCSGGISGNLAPHSRLLAALVLAGYSTPVCGPSEFGNIPYPYAVDETSVVADIGSGGGALLRALAALLSCLMVIGIDVNTTHLVTSDSLMWLALEALQKKGLTLRSLMLTGCLNAAQGGGLEPVTHMVGYVGSVQHANAICRAVARSKTLRVVLIVCTKIDLFKYIVDKEFLSPELKSLGYGYVPRQPWEAAMRLKGFCCEFGTAYFTFAMCITAERQQHTEHSMANDGVLESELATVSFNDAIAHFKRFE
jgi:hypothetical protein